MKPHPVLFAALICAAALPARAQDPDLEAAVRQAAARFAASAKQAPPAPGAPAPPAAADGPARPLTLAEAGDLALQHNLDIAVERVNASALDLQIAGVKASYLPTVSSLFGEQHQTDVPVTLLTGGEQVFSHTGTFNGAVTENVPWGGGSASVVWNNNRVFTNSFFYNYNPAFNTSLTAQYTQPLLRGFHTDAIRHELVVTKTNRDISDLQLKATIANTLSSVRNAYWDLVFATDSIDVAQKSVDLAHQLVGEDEKRVAYGTMTELDLVSARSQEATARHQLVEAEGNRRIAELALKRLLVGGPDDPLWQADLQPGDRPGLTDQAIDVEAAIRRALDGRTDLAQARKQIAANKATYDYLKDQTRPQADLVGTYALAGIGGTELLRTPDITSAFTSPPIGTIPGSYGGALSALAGRDFPTWGIAVNVSYPLGFSAARAEAARAGVQVSRAETELRRMQIAVVTDVTNAAIGVRNNVDAVRTAVTARELAEQTLAAEQKKFEAGMSTNYFVVQAQKDLADARNAELQAQVNYRKSLVEFDRVQQTTLQSAGVTIVAPVLTPLASGSGRTAAAAPSGTLIP